MAGTSMDRDDEHDDGGDDEANLLQKQRGRVVTTRSILPRWLPWTMNFHQVSFLVELFSINNGFSQGETLLV